MSMINPRPRYRLLHIRRTGPLPSTQYSANDEGPSSDESSGEDTNSDELGSNDEDDHTIDGSSDNDDLSIVSPSSLVLTDGARPGEYGRATSSNEPTSSGHDPLGATVNDIAKNVFHEFLSTDIKEKAGALFPDIPRDELAFAHWAFGPDGLTTLQVLALGDFSFQGRFADDQLLLCHKEPRTSQSADDALLTTAHGPELTFREVTGEDRNLQALVDAQSDLLEACPVDSLFRPL